jgi:Xaa-Pro aminopeptidase
MGKVTTEVVGRVAEFITHHAVKDEMVMKGEGSPLTIGDVKSKINLWLAELGAENPEDTIFAMGRDAGVPHSSGDSAAALRLGQTIVFDIFPCEAGGGYFYDFTRTWCLGHAPDEALKMYEDVRSTYQTLISELKVNTRFADYQKRTCELFSARGHPTIQENPATEEGYVHSVGHGIGLHVHELPFSGASSSETEILVPGSVFTMEPGLYYPERGLGIRLEDSVVVNADGSIQIMAEYPLDLVLPMKGA